MFFVARKQFRDEMFQKLDVFLTSLVDLRLPSHARGRHVRLLNLALPILNLVEVEPRPPSFPLERPRWIVVTPMQERGARACGDQSSPLHKRETQPIWTIYKISHLVTPLVISLN